MNDITRFITLSTLLVLTRFYDVYTTYCYIPELERETNPLVWVFNFGWPALITIQSGILILLVYTIYIYCFKPVTTIPVDQSTSLKSFVSIFYFNDERAFKQLFYQLPTNKHALPYFIGAVVPKALIIISSVVGTSTTLLINLKPYQALYEHYNLHLGLYGIMVIVIVALVFDFHQKERKQRMVMGDPS